ncbi:FAD-binding protein [Denitrobacterium detoxificans]|uniref:Tat (Twin-arginine translocation) pathway signal sequence n=1 Tax=Denitrobacterium detoxificans TaxID=79604 RepID=A0A1H8PKG3_9ACTN|nr:FAD-binding protein [Denitrobacterium detoxificans]SEO42440.1 Tat (twin-arginine translocation) pathway signal sequence [Denitrobacterium detoxificans]
MGIENKSPETTMGRRGFLKGAALAGAAAVAAAAMPGCSSPKSQSQSAEATQASTHPSGYMCSEDWLGEAPAIDESKISDVVKADVVVCGSGHSGTQAALAAAEEGASVVVLEARNVDSDTGYLHYYGQEFGHFNSQWLINQGYGPYDTGEIVTEFCRRGGNRVSPAIIRAFVDNCGEAFDHFIGLIPSDNHMLEMGPKGELGLHIAYGRNPEDYPIEMGGYKTWVGDAMFWGKYSDEPVNGVGAMSNISEAESFQVAEAERLGAKWYYGTTAVVCTQNSDGDVTGVIAKADDGSYIKFEAAKGVILATGDMGQNGEMIWNLITEVPEWCERQGVEAGSVTAMTMNDGSGLKMGCWAGGYIEPGPRPTMSMGGGGGGPWGTAPFLWVNAEGKRYMNEAVTVGAFSATLRQPIGTIATITDSKWLTTVQRASIDHGAPNYTRPQYYDDLVTDMSTVVAAGAQGGLVRTCTIAERMQSTVYGADDLETALKYAGYEGDALKEALATVARYNELCYAGSDADFGKDAEVMIPIDEPPFYVAPSSNSGKGVAGLVTLAGLMTDENLNVIRPDYTRIKGLYAVGNCLGQRFGNAYSTPTAGVSIGMAMTHGRVCGKTVANL